MFLLFIYCFLLMCCVFYWFLLHFITVHYVSMFFSHAFEEKVVHPLDLWMMTDDDGWSSMLSMVLLNPIVLKRRKDFWLIPPIASFSQSMSRIWGFSGVVMRGWSLPRKSETKYWKSPARSPPRSDLCVRLYPCDACQELCVLADTVPAGVDLPSTQYE